MGGRKIVNFRLFEVYIFEAVNYTSADTCCFCCPTRRERRGKIECVSRGKILSELNKSFVTFDS